MTQAAESPYVAEARKLPSQPWRRILLGVFLAGLLLVSLGAGVALRHWAWTTSIRHAPYGRTDITNAFRQGLYVLEAGRAIARENGRPVQPLGFADLIRGWAARYDQVSDAAVPPGELRLDYTPARLLVMSTWVWQVQRCDPEAGEYRHEYATPLLYLNLACELAGCVAAFFLVRHWVLRGAKQAAGSGPQGTRAWVLGLLAAHLLWFSPAVIPNAYVWPQWDVWIVPFFLWAVYCASRQWWLAAGLLVALGAMLKGQMVLVAPVFFLWPLFEGKLGAACRVLAGAALGMLLLTWPMLLRGSFAWIDTGFTYATRHNPSLAVPGAANLGAILHDRFSWQMNERAFTVPQGILGIWPGAPVPVHINHLMVAIYLLTLLACGVAAAVYSRRNDPRTLTAVIAPWILAFALLPQMRERYLVWGAAASVVGLAVSLDMALLHLVVTALATCMVMGRLAQLDFLASPKWAGFFEAITRGSDLAWAFLLVAAIYLYRILDLRPMARRR